MVTAAIKFVQGVNVGSPGVSLIGVTGSSVTYSNGDNNGIASWTWEWIDVPPTSSILLGVASTASSGVFTPDVRGGYLLHLVAKDITGKQIAEDYRTFQVLEPSGRLIPPAQATDTMLNFGNQKRGWAKYMEEWLRAIDSVATGLNLRGTYAARPAPGTLGRLYLCTDVAMLFFDDGTVWRPHWGVFSGQKPPSVSSLTWVNQHSLAAASDDKDTLLLTSQANAGGDDFHMLVKSAPNGGVNFRFTLGLITGFAGISNPIAIMGMTLRDSIDGNKFIRWVVYFQTNQLRVNIQKYNSPTSGNAAYFDGPLQPIITGDGGPLWLRVDEGLTSAGKLTWYYSTNNNEYFQVDQRNTTDFLPNGVTQVGVGCDCVGGVANPTIDVTGRFFDWREET